MLDPLDDGPNKPIIFSGAAGQPLTRNAQSIGKLEMRIRTQVRGTWAKHYCRLEELLHMLTASTTHKVVVCPIWQAIYELKEE